MRQTQADHKNNSHVLQQPVDDSRALRVLAAGRGLVRNQLCKELPGRNAKSDNYRHDLFWPGSDIHFILLGVVYQSHIIDHILNGRGSQQTAHCHQRFGLLCRPGHVWQCFGHHHWIRERPCLCMVQSAAIGRLERLPSDQPAAYECEFSEQSRRREFLRRLLLTAARPRRHRICTRLEIQLYDPSILVVCPWRILSVYNTTIP